MSENDTALEVTEEEVDVMSLLADESVESDIDEEVDSAVPETVEVMEDEESASDIPVLSISGDAATLAKLNQEMLDALKPILSKFIREDRQIQAYGIQKQSKTGNNKKK